MQLLRLAEVETSPRDRIFCYSRMRAAVLALIAVGGSAALLFHASTAHWAPGYFIATFVLLFVALGQRFITARFRSSNWLVRMSDSGLYIKFRSYLNYHLPAEDLTVIFIPYQEIRSARLVRERVSVPDVQGKTSTQFLRYIELELGAQNTATLEQALQLEIEEKPPTEKGWFFSGSTLYEDYPVRMSSPPFLRIRWQATPGVHGFLKALRPNVTIEDPVSITQDFENLQGLSREEQQKRLRELAQRGETIAAIYMVRRLYGCGLGEAQKIIDDLKSGTGNARAHSVADQ